MKHKSGRQFYRIVLAIWLTFSVGSVVLAVGSWMRLSARLAEGRQVTLARTQLNQIYESLLDLETGERGYVISGDTNFLEPFSSAEARLPAQFDNLVNLVHDHAVSGQRYRLAGCSRDQHQLATVRDRCTE
jgi:CHASE3 domain sensor protein